MTIITKTEYRTNFKKTFKRLNLNIFFSIFFFDNKIYSFVCFFDLYNDKNYFLNDKNETIYLKNIGKQPNQNLILKT